MTRKLLKFLMKIAPGVFPNNIIYEVIGRTVEHKPLILAKICNRGICGKKPAMWIDAGELKS